MEHPNIDPKSIVIDGKEPDVGKAYPGEANMFGSSLKWEKNDKAYQYKPMKKEGDYEFIVKVFDMTTGEYINDWNVLEQERVSEDNPVEGAEKAIEIIRDKIEG